MALSTFKFGDYNIDRGPFFADDGGVIAIADLDGFVPTLNGYIPVPRGWPVGYEYGVAYANATTRIDTDPYPISLYSYTTANFNNAWLFAKTNAAGATADLQRFDLDSSFLTTLTSVGRAGGYTDSSGWFFTRYSDTIIATNNTDAVQRGAIAGAFTKNNDTSGTPTAADPRAKYVETFKGHLFYGNIDLTVGSSGTGPETYGGAFGPLLAQAYPTILWHSGLDNERRFGTPDVTPAILGSDYRFLYDGLGPITGLKACSDYMAVFRKNGITILTGPPFNVSNIDQSIGTSASNSIVRVGSDIYFWSNRGPAKISGGGSFELLSSGIFSEALSIGKSPATSIYGAVSVDSKYVIWTYSFNYNGTYTYEQQGSLNEFYVYSIESGRFGRLREPYARNIIPMTSYQQPIENRQPTPALIPSAGAFPLKRYSPLEGMCFIANRLTYDATPTSGVTAYDILMLSGSANNSDYDITTTGPIGLDIATGFLEDLATIKTHFFKLPTSDTPKSFKIHKIRPIYWTGYATAHNNPTADERLEFDDEVKINKIRIYPLSRYESSSNVLYNEFSAIDDNGWIPCDGSPQAEMFAIQFYFENNYNLRLVYGFEMEFSDLSAYTTGKSTY